MTSIDDGAAALLLVATVGAASSLLCRLAAMSIDTTPAAVRHQHAGLFAALVLSLSLPGAAAHAALAIGVLLYLALSAPRWDAGPPWVSCAADQAGDDPGHD